MISNHLINQKTELSFNIRLYISKNGYMLDEGISSIPNELTGLVDSSNSKFSIIYTENTGSYRKIIPLLGEFFLGS